MNTCNHQVTTILVTIRRTSKAMTFPPCEDTTIHFY